MRVNPAAVSWKLFFHETASLSADSELLLPPDVAEAVRNSRQRLRRRAIPFFVDPNGLPDGIINDYFGAGGPGGRLAETSARSYAYDILVFLNILQRWEIDWWDASAAVLGDVRTWRLYGQDNERRVSDAAWQRQAQAISSLYTWGTTRGIRSPVPPTFDRARRRLADPGGAYPRSTSIKWFTSAAVAQWVNLGLRGYLPDGSADPSYRHRSGLRDGAFVRAAYGTGLRAQELGGLILGVEWPTAPTGPYATLELGNGVAKGGQGRRFWASAEALAAVHAYVSLDRRLAVAAASRRGAYDDLTDVLVVEERETPRYAYDSAGQRARLQQLSPSDRRRLFTRRDGALEPAQLWLTEQGLPLPHTAWNRIFDRANSRIAAMGVPMSRMTPHRLRHSFALKWFIIGRLLWMGRTSALSRDEADALRDEMGSEWFLVQTLLGHRSVETTRNTYLEPFIGLDIELLLSEVHDKDAEQLLTLFLDKHARVETRTSW